MAQPEKRPEAAPAEPIGPAEERPRPQLSADFFLKLLNPPSCKTTGVCDNCGRCEH